MEVWLFADKPRENNNAPIQGGKRENEENVKTTYPKRKPTKPASQCLIVRLVGNNGVAHQRHVQHGAPGSSGRKNSKPYGKISTHPLAEEETGPYPFRA